MPRVSQERPESVQERPKNAPRAPKSAQERPKNAQERPKSDPRAPKRVPRRLSRRPGELSGTIFTLLNSEKERSKSDPSRNSVEKCVRNDFRSLFASCAQERIHEKHVKTIGFYRFFACRLICQQGDAPDQKTIEKSLKSSPRRAKIDLGWIKKLLGALFEPVRTTKSVDNTRSSAVEATWSLEKAYRSDCRGNLARPSRSQDRSGPQIAPASPNSPP